MVIFLFRFMLINAFFSNMEVMCLKLLLPNPEIRLFRLKCIQKHTT